MALYENLSEFSGKRVADFNAPGDISDFSAVAPRVRCDWDDKRTLGELLQLLLDQPGSDLIEALVFGVWMEDGESYEVTPQSAIDLLVQKSTSLPALKAVFFGDIISEENEMSWIEQGDYSQLWAAYPKLECAAFRGGNGLRLGPIEHPNLKSLIVQTGGMSTQTLEEALNAKAPLRHLELWLGDEGYGATTGVSDFDDLFSGKLFADLEYLGLKNCEYTDDLAAALVQSAIIDRIKTLDLSLGTLTDKGAKALVESGKLGNIALDISHHYVGENMIAQLKLASRSLNAADAQEPDTWDDEEHYYIAVSE